MMHSLTYLDRPILTRPDPAGFEATRDTRTNSAEKGFPQQKLFRYNE